MAAYRLLVVTNLWPTDADRGYGSFVQAQMESLRARGHEYDLVFVNGREGLWNYAAGVRQMRRRIKTTRYDLLHAHFGLAGWVARCQACLPIVVSFMGDDVLGRPRKDGTLTAVGRFFRLSSWALARRVDAVIVKSEEMKAQLGLASVRVIPNGVDLELFRPMDQAEARAALGIGADKKLVLFPYNRDEARKRFDLIEGAVDRARAEVRKLEILEVRGAPRELMPFYLNAADVFVLASMLEGSPNALKEAMAVNLPVITVDVGDAAELVGRAEGCYLVPRNVEAIAARIVEVCRGAQRSRGRPQVARLSMEAVARQIEQVYDEVVSRKRKRP